MLLINRQVLRIPKLEEDFWEITVRFYYDHMFFFVIAQNGPRFDPMRNFEK